MTTTAEAPPQAVTVPVPPPAQDSPWPLAEVTLAEHPERAYLWAEPHVVPPVPSWFPWPLLDDCVTVTRRECEDWVDRTCAGSGDEPSVPYGASFEAQARWIRERDELLEAIAPEPEWLPGQYLPAGPDGEADGTREMRRTGPMSGLDGDPALGELDDPRTEALSRFTQAHDSLPDDDEIPPTGERAWKHARQRRPLSRMLGGR